jgi:dihydrofolate reductase
VDFNRLAGVRRHERAASAFKLRMPRSADIPGHSMRKLIYYVAASLDGFIARCDDGLDWLPHSARQEDHGYAQFTARIDALVMGRRTYEQMLSLGSWPYHDGWKCYVLTRKWAGQRDVHADFVGGQIGTFLRRLKKQPGRDIWLVGGGESAQACFAAGMVDEIILTVVPVLLGTGRPLFLPREHSNQLLLRGERSFADGLVQLRYEVGHGEPDKTALAG